MKKKWFFLAFFVLVVTGVYWSLLSPPGGSADTLFIVPQNQVEFDVVQKMAEQKVVRSASLFRFFQNIFFLHITIEPGGYRINKGMGAWEVLNKINGRPDLAWVSFGGCLRKEQIGEIIGQALGWNAADLEKWNAVYTASKPEYFEGVYYPDTYLLPRDEPGNKIAERLISRFNEQFAPYAQAYVSANIRWVTGLKIASLIAREAAGKPDMHLISGIIWNRLTIGMPLQIDSTMQYTLGKNSAGEWWGPIDLKEKQKDSPYNSYLYKGLPPTPICSPNSAYIEAALHPMETDCLFYLHDYAKNIHCSKTYEEHLKNIQLYLN